MIPTDAELEYLATTSADLLRRKEALLAKGAELGDTGIPVLPDSEELRQLEKDIAEYSRRSSEIFARVLKG